MFPLCLDLIKEGTTHLNNIHVHYAKLAAQFYKLSSIHVILNTHSYICNKTYSLCSR